MDSLTARESLRHLGAARASRPSMHRRAIKRLTKSLRRRGARSFHQMMGELDLRFEEYVFVDFGSGTGRAVLLAAGYPFKRVVCVELSPELHRIAQRNLLAFPRSEIRCRAIELVCQGAAHYSLPHEPSVLYLYNPFGREVMAPLVARVERSLKERARDLVVVYSAPLLGDLWAQAPSFTTFRAVGDFAIYRAAGG
jgi:SAM-dependent methyltransferase